MTHEELIQVIRMRLSSGQTKEEIAAYLVEERVVSSENAFLAFMAAKHLEEV